MALPPHLAQYDELLDMLVEAVIREIALEPTVDENTDIVVQLTGTDA